MPKNTKTNIKNPKTQPVKKPKLRPTIKKNTKSKDLEKAIRAKNLKMGIIEVLDLTHNESSYSIEPNNPLIVSSTPVKTSPPVESSQTGSPDLTKNETNPPMVESEEPLPLPLRELDNLLNPVVTPISIIVTPPTPERTNMSVHKPEPNAHLLVPPNNPIKPSKTKRPPDISKNSNLKPADQTSTRSNCITSPNVTPKLPKIRIKKIRDTSYKLVQPSNTTVNETTNNSLNHQDIQLSPNSSQLSFLQIENLNRTLQTKTAKLLEEKTKLENQLDQVKEKHRHEISKHEWNFKQAQLEIRMLKVNIQEKESKIKNQESLILSSYTGFEPDKNKQKTGERSYRDLLRDNKRLENMLSTTRKQMEEESNRKDMFKKEMLRTKRELTETMDRIKNAANDETKKIIDDLTRKCNTLTVDLELSTQKIADLKNHNKELADRVKELSNSNSIVTSDLRISAPYPIDSDPSISDTEEQDYDTRSIAEITIDDIKDQDIEVKTHWFFNANMDHHQIRRNQQMIKQPSSYQQNRNPNHRYNTNKKNIVCKYFVQNRCIFGDRCFYNHPTRNSNRKRIPDLMSLNVQRPAPWHNPNSQRLTPNLSNIYPNLTIDQFPHLSQDQQRRNPNQQLNHNFHNDQSYSQTLQAAPITNAAEELSILTNLSHNLNQQNLPVNQLSLVNGTLYHPLGLISQCS